MFHFKVDLKVIKKLSSDLLTLMWESASPFLRFSCVFPSLLAKRKSSLNFLVPKDLTSPNRSPKNYLTIKKTAM